MSLLVLISIILWLLSWVVSFKAIFLFSTALKLYIPRESKKQDTMLLPITLQNVDQFSKFFTVGLSSKRVMK